MGILGGNKSLEELEMEKQRTESQLQVEQNKAAIAEAKKRYGKDYLQFFKKTVGDTRSGIDWQAIRFRCK